MFIKIDTKSTLDKLVTAIKKADISEIYRLLSSLIKYNSNIRYILRMFTKNTKEYTLVDDLVEEIVQDVTIWVKNNIYDLQELSDEELSKALYDYVFKKLSQKSSYGYRILKKAQKFDREYFYNMQTSKVIDPSYFIEMQDLLSEFFRLYRKYFTKSDIEQILQYHKELSMNLSPEVGEYFKQMVGFLVMQKKAVTQYFKELSAQRRSRRGKKQEKYFMEKVKNVLKGYPPVYNLNRNQEFIDHFKNLLAFADKINKEEKGD